MRYTISKFLKAISSIKINGEFYYLDLIYNFLVSSLESVNDNNLIKESIIFLLSSISKEIIHFYPNFIEKILESIYKKSLTKHKRFKEYKSKEYSKR